MATTIAAYYTDELLEWANTLVFYNNEMIEFTKKFAEVIRRNSITGIAAKVEANQSLLNQLSNRFYGLHRDIQQQRAALSDNCVLVDNNQIDQETEQDQVDLRNKMQAAEKEYIELKFKCYDFLSGTLKK